MVAAQSTKMLVSDARSPCVPIRPGEKRSVRSPDCQAGGQHPPGFWCQAERDDMGAKRRSRPNWLETAARIVGILAKIAGLIETIRKIG
jgi:hypothetical protein